MQNKKTAPKIDSKTHIKLLLKIRSWDAELRKLLPKLPDKIDIEFDNSLLISATGTGGFAVAKDKIYLAFDPNFSGDKDLQLENLKGSYFHEAYHLVQGFTGEDTSIPIPAISNAILEGAATVFERDRTKSDPLWGKYEDSVTMNLWTQEIVGLGQPYDWRKYKFYDSDTGRRWIMYKVGTYIVDEALDQNPQLKIEDLATLEPAAILKLARIDLTK